MTSETCANCGAMIGKLETPHLWQNRVVCAACYPRLSPKPPVQLLPGHIICPNPRCGYIGPPAVKPKGSTMAGCALSLCFVLPGILYLLLTKGNRYSCPRCGVFIRSD